MSVPDKTKKSTTPQPRRPSAAESSVMPKQRAGQSQPRAYQPRSARPDLAHLSPADQQAIIAYEKQRKRQKARHGVVLGTLVAFLVVVTIGAVGSMNKWWSFGFLEKEFVGAANKCASVGVVPLASEVTVRVTNASGKAGVATATAAKLRERSFVVGGIGDAKPSAAAGDVVITYNENRSAAAAEVVSKHFKNPKMVVNNKLATTVEVTINNGKTELISPDVASAAVTTLVNNGQKLQKLCLDGR